MQGPTDQKDPLAELRAELSRLRQKRAETKDRDIMSALDMRIAQIEKELPTATEAKPTEVVPASAEPETPEEESQAEEAPPPPAPTPEQAAEAESLIRAARVEKMRNNAKGATDLLRKAAEVAPGSPTVLEALGDDLVERKRLGEARTVYKRAMALDPKNVGLEKKHANAVFHISAVGSLDEQMRRNLSDPALFTSEDKIASLPMAIILSAVLPGSGHLVLGQTSRGFWILGAWVVFSIWLLAKFGDVAKLLAFGVGGREQPNLVVLVPMVFMAVIYVATLGSLKNIGKDTTRKPPNRPKPPVDLPFE